MNHFTTRGFLLLVSTSVACLLPEPTLAELSSMPQSEQNTFDFLLGEHKCQDTITDLEGNVSSFDSIWRGELILGGRAIQDHYRNPEFEATNIRVFDVTESVWRVTYFREPGGVTGVWTGGKIRDEIVLTRKTAFNGTAVISRLVFSDISDDGFSWRSEYESADNLIVHWTSLCKPDATT